MLKIVARCVAVAALLSVPLAQAAEAGAAKTVKLPEECPTSGPHRACLFLELVMPPDSPSPAAHLGKAGKIARLIPVRGRFTGGAHNVRLVISAPGASDDHFVVPYLGRSKHNHP